MKICAVIHVEQDLSDNQDGVVLSIPSDEIVGYVIYENGEIISKLPLVPKLQLPSCYS